MMKERAVNNAEKVRLIAEAVGWAPIFAYGGKVIAWRDKHTAEVRTVTEEHLTDLGALHALRWAGSEASPFKQVQIHSETCLRVVGGDDRDTHHPAWGGWKVEWWWGSKGFLDVDTVRDVLAEAIERSRE